MRASEIQRLPAVVSCDKKQYVLLLGRCNNHKNPNYVNPLYVPVHLVIVESLNNELPEIICVSELEGVSSVHVTKEILEINEHFLPESPATRYFAKMHSKYNASKGRGADGSYESMIFLDPCIASALHVGHPFWQQKLLVFIHDERQALLETLYSTSVKVNNLQATEEVIIKRGMIYKEMK